MQRAALRHANAQTSIRGVRNKGQLQDAGFTSPLCEYEEKASLRSSFSSASEFPDSAGLTRVGCFNYSNPDMAMQAMDYSPRYDDNEDSDQKDSTVKYNNEYDADDAEDEFEEDEKDEEEDEEDEEDEQDQEEAYWAGIEAREEKISKLGTVRNELLKKLSAQLSHGEKNAVFAIGGSIFMPDDHPLTIRWGGSLLNSSGHMCQLPTALDENREQAFEKLLKHCQPATFGIGTHNVLDEQYRKAGKMDAKDFCTSFNLAEFNIMDTVTQALAKTAGSQKDMHGLKAELYKLNVYSGPNGKFEKHVDTPRSANQMGSLVVCLPSVHEGGELVVRHADQEVVFDWSEEKAEMNTIKWAAMFSDCEHEVRTVMSGHRITLTYNLYWTKAGPAHMADNLTCFDQDLLPIYQTLEGLFDCEAFLPNGGLIGFKCTHGYPHTSEAAIKDGITPTLKGLDMVIYQALKHLAGKTTVSSIFDPKRTAHYRHYNDSDEEDQGYVEPEDHRYTDDTPKKFTVMTWGPQVVVAYPGGFGDWTWAEGVTNLSPFSAHKVTWLNGMPKKFEEMQVATMVYGNEGGTLDTYYTAAAIVAELPSYDARKGL